MNKGTSKAIGEIRDVVRQIDAANEILDRLMRSAFLTVPQRREVAIQNDRLDKVAHVLAGLTENSAKVNR